MKKSSLLFGDPSFLQIGSAYSSDKRRPVDFQRLFRARKISNTIVSLHTVIYTISTTYLSQLSVDYRSVNVQYRTSIHKPKIHGRKSTDSYLLGL